MRLLIISAVLAVCLFGCGEKAKFSFSGTDTPETYANNPAFKELILDKRALKIFYKDSSSIKEYLFSGAPVSIQSIKTDDLGIDGGSIMVIPEKKLVVIRASLKGKANFNKFFDRLKKVADARNMDCSYVIEDFYCLRDRHDRHTNINHFALTYFNDTGNVAFGMRINNN